MPNTFLSNNIFEFLLVLRLDYSNFILEYQGYNLAQTFKENIPTFVNVVLHHKTKQEYIFCISNAKVHLKAAL